MLDPGKLSQQEHCSSADSPSRICTPEPLPWAIVFHQVRLDRLQQVYQATKGKAELVLHGSGGFTEDIYRDCIERGVTKINVNVQLIEPWSEMMGARRKFVPLTAVIEDSIAIFQKEVERLMDMVGSTEAEKQS